VLAEQDRDRAEAAVRRQAELNRHQALHDSLTCLPNRVLFQDRVRQVIRSAERKGGGVAVLVMDLDRFKEINDTIGHPSGDQLLHDGSPTGVAGAAGRIQAAFAAPFSLEGLPLQIEASIGAATYPEHAHDVEGLIQRADIAMYVAKRDNSGWELYDRGADRNQPQRLSLISELRRAIDERELVLHYQPKLEITESAIVADMFRMRGVLERLGDMGLRLSVDDFGTGYTSLGYLRRLPISELKIDRSFVSHMATSEEDAVIVRSTIDLGRNLGLGVVAEGVEDPEVLEQLRALGCDVAQGYLMSRPIPGDELIAWLGEFTARSASPR
jgi:predicted signal transduction protein with EAL and GGDEF domain